MDKEYSLRKSRKILHQGETTYLKKKGGVTEGEASHLFHLLRELRSHLVDKERASASRAAHKVENFIQTHFAKKPFDHVRDFLFALVFALVVAFLVREFWFELYEVPTGSMRPTILEQDRLVVSKTNFGLHIPFQNKLALFKPEYIQRNGIIVFTVEDMDISDADTTYFYLFPGKKRYIKRCLGKPGDTLYFYGGRIYGVDKDKKEIQELYDEEILQANGLTHIEHIPYISFEGRVELKSPLSGGLYGTSIFRQMNIPLGKLELDRQGSIKGYFFNGKEWLLDQPAALKEAHAAPKSYADLFGMGNYANARLLNKDQVTLFYGKEWLQGEDTLLYLELRHTANLTYPLPEMRRDEGGRLRPTITPMATLLPLNKNHLHTLQKALFTSRFYVKGGHAFRYHEENLRPQRAIFDPLFPEVADGCYEFEAGVGYKIGWGAIRSRLRADHPLYEATAINIQKLFNLGINFNLLFQPVNAWQPFVPERFAYYRNGDLYVMGKTLMNKEDKTLISFITSELEKEANSTEAAPYVAFIDHGAPPSVEFIEAFGLKIPEEGALALGDNYAMSADSRDFGFVPTHNLRGAPVFTFWPPSSRVGALPQTPYPYLKLPNILVAIALLIVASGCYYYYKKRKETFKS